MTHPATNNPCKSCPTRTLCLASGLDETALDSLADCVKPSAPLSKGRHLYREGNYADRCYVVRSGVFKTFTMTPAGDEYVTGFHYPGELLGITGQATGRHADSAIALETSTACRVRLDDMATLWEIGGGPSLMRMLGQSEKTAAGEHINLGQVRADARVAGYLLQLSGKQQQLGRDKLILHTPMSRTDLANFLGMTLESLSRVMGRFSKAGLITSRLGEIVLERPEELKTLARHLPESN
jgi:CRP/FNR family transcriptional regulator